MNKHDKMLLGSMFAMTTIAILVLNRCSPEAKGSGATIMDCSDAAIGVSAQRCESDEAICFVRGEAMSCVKK